MALYGSAYVNGKEIVDWEARRIHSGPVNIYEVTVNYYDTDDHLHQLKGQVEHVGSALALMSKVMAWADKEVKRD